MAKRPEIPSAIREPPEGEQSALPPEEVARLTAAYLKALENKYARLGSDETRPPLESVFFMLQARERPERRPLEPPPGDLPMDPARRLAADAPLPLPFGKTAGGEAPPAPLGEVLSKEPRLVILGEPGAGKTTALQFVALCFARRAEGGRPGWHQERPGIAQPYVPILLTLQTHAAAIAERHLFDVLVDEVRSYLPGCSEDQAAALLRAWQAAEGVLVLLDGLDEVTEARRRVEEEIEKLGAAGWRLVVTSRPAGFTPLSGLREYILKPLDEEEALTYLTAWLRTLREIPELEARQQATDLLEKMRARPSLKRLTNNPLLLRLSAEYYARTGDIVRNRAELYRAWVEEAWRRAERRGARPEQKERALAALEALAWHRQMGGENTEMAFCQVLRDHGLAATPQQAEDLLVLLREKVGLLAREVERRDGKDIPRYLFAHQTVREYFVALHLKRAWEQNARRTWRFLKPRLHLAEWREPLLLLAGLLAEEEAQRLITWVWRARSPHERLLWRNTQLAVEMIGDSGRHPPVGLLSLLRNKLKDKNLEVRWAAAEALGMIGNPQAIPALQEALKDENPEVRWAAAQALGMIGNPQTIPALQEALKDENPEVRWAAAQALGMIGNPQTIPALQEALKDENPEVRWAAAQALGMIGNPQTIPALQEALKDENPEVRWAAAQALGMIGNPQTIPALQEALKDENPEVRWAAAQALGMIGNPQTIPALQEALKDENPEVRWAAAQALGMIGNPQTIPALQEALKDENPEVRWAAAQALEKITLAAHAEGQRMEAVLSYLMLIQTAARYRAHELLRAALELQATWRLRHSRWRDPIQPSPCEEWLRRIGRFLVFVLLLMISELLRKSLDEVAQILQERLRSYLKSLPLPLLILLGMVIVALVALLILKRVWGR